MSCALKDETHAKAVAAALGDTITGGNGGSSAADFMPAVMRGNAALFYTSSATWSVAKPPSVCQATGQCADGRYCFTKGKCTGDASVSCTPQAKTCLVQGKGTCGSAGDGAPELQNSLECGYCAIATSTACTSNSDCTGSGDTCAAKECYYGKCDDGTTECNDNDDCAGISSGRCSSWSLGVYTPFLRYCYCMDSGSTNTIVG